MSRSYVPPPDTVIGVQMMSHLFEHQMRMAHVVGTAMLTANPMLARRTAASRSVDATDRRKAPAQMPKMVRRTHATPV